MLPATTKHEQDSRGSTPSTAKETDIASASVRGIQDVLREAGKVTTKTLGSGVVGINLIASIIFTLFVIPVSYWLVFARNSK